MRTIFSTQNLHPRDRLSYWLDVTCKMVVVHDSRPDCPTSFNAKLETESLADVQLLRVTISRNKIAHNKQHISRSLDDDLLFCRALTGQYTVEQDGREVTIQPGGFMMLEKRLPYAVKFPSQQSKVLIAKVPRRELENRIGQVADFVGRSYGGPEGVNGLTSSFLETVAQYADSFENNQDMVRNQLLDLLAISLLHDADRVPRLSSSKTLLRLRLREAMAARLSHPHVTVGEIAAAAGVSVRHANALLADRSQSISDMFQAMRLNRCKQTLEDPLQAHRSITEIAYAWGFSDVTHFGRRFKKMYGLLPSEFREKCKREAPSGMVN